MGRPLLSALFVGLVVAGGCGASNGTTPDGARCSSSDDCKSGSCYDGLCRGTRCSCGSTPCEQSRAPECSAGWRCAYIAASTPVFGQGEEASYRCRPTCDACPAHHACNEDGLCSPIPNWQAPVVTATGGAIVEPGTVVQLHAEATSPIGAAIVKYEWNLPKDDFTGMHVVPGQDVTLTPTRVTTLYRATVSVKDAEGHTGTADVDVTVCGRTGDECGATRSEACCGAAKCNSFRCE